MPVKRIWTAEEDATIRQMRTAGATRAAIAEVLGVLSYTIQTRMRQLGVTIRVAAVEVEETEEKISRPNGAEWDALPAGHPISWGAVTRGTWLEGTSYPTGK